MKTVKGIESEVKIGRLGLMGNFTLPKPSTDQFVIFAHGSGSSRNSPRNRYVAEALNQAGIGTLLMDLVTAEEEMEEDFLRHIRFNIDLLAARLVEATEWLEDYVYGTNPKAQLKVGYFGASTGAAAAFAAASVCPDVVHAVVSRGGRPDLAGQALKRIQVPVLLIVGSEDVPVLDLNQEAMEQLASAEKELVIVSGASHLFEEPGTLEEVSLLATRWFKSCLSH